MELDIIDGTVHLRNIYEPITLETSSGQRFTVWGYICNESYPYTLLGQQAVPDKPWSWNKFLD